MHGPDQWPARAAEREVVESTLLLKVASVSYDTGGYHVEGRVQCIGPGLVGGVSNAGRGSPRTASKETELTEENSTTWLFQNVLIQNEGAGTSDLNLSTISSALEERGPTPRKSARLVGLRF